MRIRPFPVVLAAASVLLAGSSLHAQSYSIALQEGDSVPGVGNVALISGVRTNNLGQTFIATDTDNPDTSVDFVLMLDGAVVARQGDPIDPPGASINLIDEMDLDNSGNYAFNTTLSGTSAAMDEAIYFNGNLLLQQGSTLTGATFPPGTTLIDTDGIRLNDAGTHLVRGEASNGEVLFTVGTDGSMSLIALEGQTLPGLSDPLQNMDLAPEGYSINKSGQVLFAGDTSGPLASDSFIYLAGTGPVAQEGSASPVAGLDWGPLTSVDVSLNDSGNYAYTAKLATGSTGDDAVLLINDMLVAREGSAVPGIAGALFSDLISAKFELDEAGNLLWAAGYRTAEGQSDRGLFYNDTLLLQEGVSRIDGLLVEGFPLSSETLSLSDDGQYALVEVTLEGGLETAVLIVIPEPAALGLLATAATALLMRRRR